MLRRAQRARLEAWALNRVQDDGLISFRVRTERRQFAFFDPFHARAFRLDGVEFLVPVDDIDRPLPARKDPAHGG